MLKEIAGEGTSHGIGLFFSYAVDKPLFQQGFRLLHVHFDIKEFLWAVVLNNLPFLWRILMLIELIDHMINEMADDDTSQRICLNFI